jgi:aromatic ring hydroxylase
MTDDRHCRIYENGECVDLDAICSMYAFNPKIPGDEERAERENRERNRRVYKELQEKGLDMMSVNTYLSLNKVPPSEENK